MKSANYKKLNRDSWNKRTDLHIKSDFYDNDGFIKGRNSLNSIELDLLGDINGKQVLHLQCHFGQDTISLTRLGAHATGVDISDRAIEEARKLAEETRSDAEFIRCDLYDLPGRLDRKFDIVFSSYGTIGWLPDVDKWAALINRYLKKGGRFVFAEFHPFVWMYDDDFSKIRYSYFNTGPIIEAEQGTYADKTADLIQEQVWWNHGLGEVIQGLIDQDLVLKRIREFDYSPYSNFNGSEQYEPGKYRIRGLDSKIPIVYALEAVKNS